MQHLRAFRLHSRPKAGGHDQNVQRSGRCVVGRHSKILDDYGGERLFAAVEDDLGETIRVVPDFLAAIQQVSAHDLGRLIERIVNRIVNADLISAFGGIEFSLLFADASIVHDDEIEMNFGRVLLDRLEVFRARCSRQSRRVES